MAVHVTHYSYVIAARRTSAHVCSVCTSLCSFLFCNKKNIVLRMHFTNPFILNVYNATFCVSVLNEAKGSSDFQQNNKMSFGILSYSFQNVEF